MQLIHISKVHKIRVLIYNDNKLIIIPNPRFAFRGKYGTIEQIHGIINEIYKDFEAFFNISQINNYSHID